MIKHFELGRLLATPGVVDCLHTHGMRPQTLVALHAKKQWGTLDTDDVQANERAIVDGGRILSVYDVAGTKVYVITEAVANDGRRSCTTVLLASEY